MIDRTKLALALAVVASPVSADVPKVTSLGLNAIERMAPEGEIIVSVPEGADWKRVGTLSFDRFLRERTLDLSGHLEGGAKVRLEQRGGGAAHLDSVLLGSAGAARIGGVDARAASKLSKKDDDIIDILGRTIELTFDRTDAAPELRVTARMEGERIPEVPFRFPGGAGDAPFSAHSSSFAYSLFSSTGALEIDGELTEVAAEVPFFREWSNTGTGHPSGHTYGWVRNDEKNLYVALDFTPDNTFDGKKDYATVHAKTPRGAKAFRVAVGDDRWGLPGFTYTSRVGYQHKVYELAIPLAELGIEANASGIEVELAFDLYGTAGPGEHLPALTFDPGNRRFFLIFQDRLGTSDNVAGQFVDPDTGAPSGAPITIGDSASFKFTPDVAFEPTTARYLAVWLENGEVVGQLVNADGTVVGTTNMPIAMTANGILPKHAVHVEADPSRQRFLVVWRETTTDVFAQLVDTNGNLVGSSFLVADNQAPRTDLDLTADPGNGRFLAAFGEQRGGGATHMFGQIVAGDGTLPFTNATTNFQISNGPVGEFVGGAAFDTINSRYLTAYQYTVAPAGERDLRAQLLAADGTPFGTPITTGFVVSDAPGTALTPSATFNPVTSEFVVVWSEGANVRGQRLDLTGAPVGTATNTNFSVLTSTVNQAAISTDTVCGHVLVAAESNAVSPPDIDLALLTGPGCPEIEVEDTVAPTMDLSVSFGNVTVGQSTELLVTIHNVGLGDLVIGTLAQVDAVAPPFSITNDLCSVQTLAAAETCTFGVTFLPTAAGAAADALDIPSDDADESSIIVAIDGTGVDVMDAGSAGASGASGSAGAAGIAGAGGQGGASGAAGVGAAAGTSGNAGTAGVGGTAGNAGTTGSGGATGGSGGAAGTGGTGGATGSGGASTGGSPATGGVGGGTGAAAGTGGSGTGQDAGVGAGTGSEPESDGGCGCRTVSSPTRTPGSWAAFVLLALALRRRRLPE